MSDLINGIYKLFSRDSESDLTDDAVNGLQQRELGYNRGRQWLTYRDTDDTIKRFGLVFHYDSRSFTSFANAITTLGAENCTLIVAQQEAISTAVTVPSNIHIMVVGSGSFDISTGNILTINGQLTAPARKIFNGLGTATLGATANTEYIQQWWGGDKDSFIQIGQTKVSNSRYYSLGIDESDSSKLKISYGATGAAPGTNDYLSIDISGQVHVYNNMSVAGILAVTGNATIGGTLGVTGNTSLTTLSTSGLATLNSLSVTTTTLVGGTLGVTGNTSLTTLSTSGLATLNSLSVTGTTTLSSTLNVVGDFSVNTNKFTVAASSGNTAVAGTLGVTGVMTLVTNPIFSWLSANKIPFSHNDGSTVMTSSSLLTYNSSTQTFATQNGTFAGTLGVTGAVSLSSSLTFAAGQDIIIADNSASSLTITQSGNPYLRFITTDGSEKMTLFKSVEMSSTLAVTGITTLSNTLTFGANGSAANGSLWKSAGAGLSVRGIAGSSYDFSLFDTGGAYLFRNLTGTQNLEFPGSGSIAITGAVTMASSLAVSGRVGIGTTPPTSSGLDLALVASSGSTTQHGIISQMTFSTGATVAGKAMYAEVKTAAGVYTMTSAMGLQIADASKGASSTITTQYGLKVENQTQGGTNYAIYTGTGAVRFGDVVAMSSTLDVTGNIFASGVGSGYWMNTLGTFTYGMYTSGTSLAFRSGSASPFLTVNSSGVPTFANAVIASSSITSAGAIIGNLSGSGTSSAFLASSAAPTITWVVTGAASNEKNWDIQGAATTLAFRTRTDANASGVDWLTVTRSGTAITSAAFLAAVTMSSTCGIQGNTTVGGTFNVQSGKLALDGVGAVTMSSTLVVGGSGAASRTLHVTGSSGDVGTRINAPTGSNSYLELTENNSTSAGNYWQIGKEPTTNRLFFYNGSTRLEISSAGAVGIGGTLAITGTSTLTGNVAIGTAVIAAIGLKVSPQSTLTGTSQYGILCNTTFASSATSQAVGGYFSIITANSVFTTTSAIGLQVDSPTKGASNTITTAYGLKIEDQSAGGTNYSIYTGTGSVRIGDIVSIGAASSPGTNVGIAIRNNLLATSSQYSLTSDSVFNSSATTKGVEIYAQLQTANSSFTMVTGIGLMIDSPNKGAASTITTAYGLKIENQTAGGTNYAIHTGSGTVQFGGTVVLGNGKITTSLSYVSACINAEMSGTDYLQFNDGGTVRVKLGAAGSTNYNYFNLNTILGTDTSPSYKLDVRGTFGASGVSTFSSTTDASAGAGAVVVSGGLYAAKIVYSDSYFISTATGKNSYVLNSTGSNFGFISNTGSNAWALGTGTTAGTLGTSCLTWDSGGNIAIPNGFLTCTYQVQLTNGFLSSATVYSSNSASNTTYVGAGIYNSNVGNASAAAIQIGMDSVNAHDATINYLGSGYATSGNVIADSLHIRTNTSCPGGITLRTKHSSAALRFVSGNDILALTIDGSQVSTFSGEVKLSSANTVSASVTNTVTNKIKMVVNGTTYYLLASTSGA